MAATLLGAFAFDEQAKEQQNEAQSAMVFCVAEKFF